MNAEFVFPSPFMPVRQEKILRLCKQHSEGMWAVVDVSVDTIPELPFQGSSMKWRRLPSGCIVQDVSNGYSLVITYQTLLMVMLFDRCISLQDFKYLCRTLIILTWQFGRVLHFSAFCSWQFGSFLKEVLF